MCGAIGFQLLTRYVCASCHVAAGDGKTVWVAVGSPYWDARVVNLDTMCCVSILLHLIASLYYNNNMIVIEDLVGAASLDSVLVAANIVCFAVIGGLFAVNLLEKKFTVSAVRTISRRIARTVAAVQIELQRSSSGFMQHVQIGQATRATTAVDLPAFKDAVQHVASSSLTSFSPAVIEAVYYTLLLMDTDPTVVERASLSLRIYEKISSAAPLSMKIVRAPAFCCCFESLCVLSAVPFRLDGCACFSRCAALVRAYTQRRECTGRFVNSSD